MKTLIKDTFREIRASFGRFLSILLIITLGVGFFAGLKATAPDMKLTGDKYFRDNKLMDFMLISTIGFDDKDLEAIRELKDIDRAVASYSMDVLLEKGEGSIVTRLMSYSKDINKPILVEGSYPENPGECMLEDSDLIRANFKLGDEISISSGKKEPISDFLERDSYKLVGFAQSPLYLTHERGSSQIGNGKLSSFMLVNPEDFKMDYYTEVYLATRLDHPSFSQDYKDAQAKTKRRIKKAADKRIEERYQAIKEELDKKIEEGRQEFEQGKESAQEDLRLAKEDLDQGWSQYNSGLAQLKSAREELDRELGQSREKISLEKSQLVLAEEELEKSLEEFDKREVELKENIKKINTEKNKLEIELQNINLDIASINRDLETASPLEKMNLNTELFKLEFKKSELNTRLFNMDLALESAQQIYNLAQSTITGARSKIEDGKRQLEEGEALLNSKEKEYRTRFQTEEAKLAAAKKKLEQADKDYEAGLEKFQEESSQAEYELKKSQQEIENFVRPSWYIIARNESRDYIEFEMGADRIDSVSKVFPVFFLLIALLVCLTTMTRMIDEQRGYIGTLKSLGYSNLAILSKYMIYSLLASILGSSLGLLLGFKIFPTIIFNAYRIMFIMPPVIIEFNMLYALISTLAAIITTSMATIIAVKNELRETTANLLRPKAPKPGQRILLERIDFIWSRLSFSKKVTARNIFRYKRRLFMTIIGIAGCTALLVAGFGIKDSIMDINYNQFKLISRYQLYTDSNNGIIRHRDNPLLKFLDGDSRIDEYILAREEIIKIKKEEEEKDINLVVVEDDKDFQDFVLLRDRKSQEEYELFDDDLIISEKIATILKLKVGDLVTLVVDDEEYELEITNITENYAYHYVYIREALYNEVFPQEVDFNKTFIRLDEDAVDNGLDFQDDLSRDLLDLEEVSSVVFLTSISQALNDTMDSLNYVIIVIIVTAGALAFIVLYNLTNINVSERTREIATIKVLGFYNKEVSSYVFRENNILTVLGIGLGLAAGFFLHKFVIFTVEIEMIMFGRNVRPLSYLFSLGLTIVFSQLVHLVMHFKLKRINMVESLKSID